MSRRAWDPGAPPRAETGPTPEKWAARDGVMPEGATSEDVRLAHEERAGDVALGRAADACSPLGVVVWRKMQDRLACSGAGYVGGGRHEPGGMLDPDNKSR